MYGGPVILDFLAYAGGLLATAACAVAAVVVLSFIIGAFCAVFED